MTSPKTAPPGSPDVRRKTPTGRNSRSRSSTSAGRSTNRRCIDRSAHAWTRSSTSAACPATASTTWRCRRRCSHTTVENLAAARLVRPPDSPPFARLIVEKPIGRDLASARSINDAIAVGLRRAADLPDRSLSGQGNGPEHSRAPVRQQHLRTALQSEVHRSRPDHGGGRRRGRQARRLLRAGGRAARHGAESHPPARRAGGDGAAAIG